MGTPSLNLETSSPSLYELILRPKKSVLTPSSISFILLSITSYKRCNNKVIFSFFAFHPFMDTITKAIPSCFFGSTESPNSFLIHRMGFQQYGIYLLQCPSLFSLSQSYYLQSQSLYLSSLFYNSLDVLNNMDISDYEFLFCNHVYPHVTTLDFGCMSFSTHY